MIQFHFNRILFAFTGLDGVSYDVAALHRVYTEYDWHLKCSFLGRTSDRTRAALAGTGVPTRHVRPER